MSIPGEIPHHIAVVEVVGSDSLIWIPAPSILEEYCKKIRRAVIREMYKLYKLVNN